MIVDLIVQSQKCDSDATLTLIKKFDPLLKKYAYKLHYDDAYNDLLSDFIELLKNIRLDRMRDTTEGILVSYIYTSIRSSYIKRLIALKKLHNIISYSAISDSELYYTEAASATSDTYFELELAGIDYVLTESEFNIVKMIYLLGYTVTETASIYGISRQAVNQTKKRALQKLGKGVRTSIE
ncbi:sigma-70 family RNA polymerase sigma factor [Desulfitobacterium sp.]|uniref:RNA polymerase sigma factor n=1 Tax=Desulfitobacterium sp. TaxID=49981 RepID=UPI002CD2E124|nr:sigma-70 family RNA polymerase sigma factor [Desulfitobacterium sp.]HVJ49840.1 sigma-70 family RNA polymerase sigma factor [Desulfitobacterium sp.]